MNAGTAAVLGLGLIGGSIARELAARGTHVLGYDRDPDTLLAARQAGVVDRELDAGLAGLAEAELVILAVPVDAAPSVLATARPHLTRARLVSDVGSTKRAIVECAHELGLDDRFVGAHPMAGDHRAGWDVSRLNLFEGVRVYLCPTETTGAPALRRAESFWTMLGASSVHLDIYTHDELLAWTSHLPQAASTALALALDAAGIDREVLGTGGYDVTRLAGSSPDMWTGIALENAERLTEALTAMSTRIEELRTAVRAGDAAKLHSLFSKARRWSAAAEPVARHEKHSPFAS